MIEQYCPVAPVTPDDGHHYFFGYYDKCPWSQGEDYLLAHRALFANKFPSEGDRCEVGLIEPSAGTFHKLDVTTAWNWQQGAQLQWLPSHDSSTDRIIFNDCVDGKARAAVVEVGKEEKTYLNDSVYALASNEEVALTLNYARLNKGRAEYGYPGVLNECSKGRAPEDDGIWKVDLNSGESTLLISLAELAHHWATSWSEESHHFVNHLMFNPSATRFCFLHRFQRPDGIWHSRLFTLGAEGNNLRLLFEGMVSHFHWRNDNTLLAWAGRREILGTASDKGTAFDRLFSAARRVLKPIYYALGKPRFLMNRIVGDSYLLIADSAEPEARPFAEGELTTDGHCTFNRGGSDPGRWVLTDGYPDFRSRQPLFLWDTKTDTGYEIGRYSTPRNFDGPIRVDLHPRFNRDATKICVDSAMDGTRKMYVVDVSSITDSPTD